MKKVLKKIGLTAMAIPLIALYSGQTGTASAAESQDISIKIEYECSAPVPIIGSLDFQMPTTLTGNISESVNPGGAVTLENLSVTVSIPENPVGETLSDLGRTELTGQVTTVNVNSINESDTVNVAEGSIPIPDNTTVPDSGDIEFTVSANDATFVAGQDGEVTLKAGEIITEIETGIVPVTATCEPKEGEDNVIATVTISEDADDDNGSGNDEDPGDGEPGDDEDQGDNDDGEPGDDEHQGGNDDGTGTEDEDADDNTGNDEDDGDNNDNGTDGDGNGTTNTGGNNDGSDDEKKNGTGNTGDENEKGGELPKTATNTPLIILLGSIIAIAGGALVLFRKKQVMTE